MKDIAKTFLSRTSKKYYLSEIIASLVALATSALGASVSARLTDYNLLVSIISAISGTTGFVLAALAVYILLHIRQYKAQRRDLKKDLANMTGANLHGIWAMYAFRIPFQYILLRAGVTPALSAVIAQAASGLIATAVRMYINYKKKIFAH